MEVLSQHSPCGTRSAHDVHVLRELLYTLRDDGGAFSGQVRKHLILNIILLIQIMLSG
jgi:hypothetical protein